MISRIKIQAQESAVFNGQDKYIANFVIPGDGVYDLQNSSLSLKTTIKALQVDKVTAATGKHNVSLKYRPSCLVQNCQLKTDKLGILEDMRYNNVRQSNLESLVYSEQSLNDNAVVNGMREKDNYNHYWSPFMDHDEVELRVPLPNLFPGMAIPQYPASGVGNTNIEVEFQNPYNATILQENIIYEDLEIHYDNVLADAKEYTTAKDYVLADFPLKAGNSVTIYYMDGADEKNQTNEVDTVAQDGAKVKVTMKDGATDAQTTPFTLKAGEGGGLRCKSISVGAATREIELNKIYNDAADTGLWVGQKVNVVYKEGSSADLIIEKIEVDATTYVVTVTFTDASGTIPNPATSPHISEAAANNLAYEIDNPSLILTKLNVNMQQQQKMGSLLKRGVNLSFRTWSLETINMDAVAEFNRQFFLESGCSNVILLFVATPSLDSAQTNLASYRAALNGVDLTTTDIEVNTPLYKDRLMYTLANAGLPVVNLNDNNLMVAYPIPFADESQMFNIKLTATSGSTLESSVLYLFKQINRVLRL